MITFKEQLTLLKSNKPLALLAAATLAIALVVIINQIANIPTRKLAEDIEPKICLLRGMGIPLENVKNTVIPRQHAQYSRATMVGAVELAWNNCGK